MNRLKATLTAILSMAATTAAVAAEGPVPTGVPHIDHLFVIMMENHSFRQVVDNPAMPYINQHISKRDVNLATNYFAVGHPSLTNYLEIVGGSNFGVRSDNGPDWHNNGCVTNLRSGIPNADNDSGNYPHPIETTAICPISGTGTDAATEAVDNWNETEPPVFNYLANIDGVKSYAAAKNTSGKTIADQLVARGLSWKTYQESLPLVGADRVDNSNGVATNLTTYDANSPLTATNLPPLNTGSLVNAYAVKHNPFAYFQSVQEGWNQDNSLKNVVPFDGPHGLYTDLAEGKLPSFAYIVPNQCDDQHGRDNADAFCQEDQGLAAYDGVTDGTQLGMNPGLSLQADAAIQRITSSIKASKAWKEGFNAIVVVWDENDYSGLAKAQKAGTLFPAQNQNTVVLTVETNEMRAHKGVRDNTYYNSFSLLKTMEAGFRLPCLNHACDKDTAVMKDLFTEGR